MGVLFFFICFPIQQFNEILEYRTDNPQQQPRNPWFVMSSMLYCKQTQAAYQGSKYLLSYARSLPCEMGKKKKKTNIFLPFEENNLKPDFDGKRASEHKRNQVSFVQNKSRMIVLFMPSRSYCNGLGLGFTENNHSLSKLTLGWTVYCRERALQPKRTPQIIFRSGSNITGLLLVCFLQRLHRSRKYDSVFVFLCLFRSGSAFVPSQRPGLLAAESSLCGVHFHSNKRNSHVLSRYSHMSPFTDLLLYVSNNFRILGLSVICCKSDSAQSKLRSCLISHLLITIQ